MKSFHRSARTIQFSLDRLQKVKADYIYLIEQTNVNLTTIQRRIDHLLTERQDLSSTPTSGAHDGTRQTDARFDSAID